MGTLMPNLKKAISLRALLFLFSLFGLIILAYCLYSELGTSKESTAALVRTSSDTDVEELKGEVLKQDERLSIVLPSHPSFSPHPGEAFLVSFYFRQISPPVYNRRQRLILHYEADITPYKGWAVAFRRFASSSRFEFYLQDSKGKGGWFSFDSVELGNSTWYSVAFVLETGTMISAYLSELDEGLNSGSNSIKLGGFPLEGLADVNAISSLQVTSGRPKIGTFRGNVDELTILKLPELPDEGIFRSKIKDGPRGVLRSFPDNCVLSLRSESSEAFNYKCEIDSRS